MSQPTMGKYAAECKKRTVTLAIASEQPMAQTGRDLGVNTNLSMASHLPTYSKVNDGNTDSRYNPQMRSRHTFPPTGPCLTTDNDRSHVGEKRLAWLLQPLKNVRERRHSCGILSYARRSTPALWARHAAPVCAR